VLAGHHFGRLLLAATLAAGCAAPPHTPPPARLQLFLLAPPPARLQLFLLAGQSNMAGRGIVEDQDRIEHPRVFTLDRSLRWVPATEPIHFDKRAAGVGPGRAFGVALATRDTTIYVGLIPTAVGGSPISSWEPGAVYAETGTRPYDDAIRRAREAMKAGDLKAVLWHQGESDANPRDAALYDARLRALVQRFRTDLGVPDLPVLVGQLGRFENRTWTPARVAIDSIHRALPSHVARTAYVSSAGLRDKGDSVHFSAAAARELGARYANAYLALLGQSPAHPAPPVSP
jgi:hypothetical protein